MGGNRSSCCSTPKVIETNFPSVSTQNNKHMSRPQNSGKITIPESQLSPQKHQQKVQHSKQIKQITSVQKLQQGLHSSKDLQAMIEKDLFEKINALVSQILHKERKWDDFNILGRAGKGGYSDVFVAELKDDPRLIKHKYAIKRMNKDVIKKQSLVDNIRLQKLIMEESKSSFITHLNYFFRDQEYYYMVMEWAAGGDLYNCIYPDDEDNQINIFQKNGEQAIRFVLGSIILSLEYLHSKNIIYCDLKPQNVLIFSDGYVKLADFGLAIKLKEGEHQRMNFGTCIYFAPQVFFDEDPSPSVDIWALGVLAFQMATSELPFTKDEINDDDKFQLIVQEREKKRNWHEAKISQNLKDLINGLLKLFPHERLAYKGWSKVKDHKFFKQDGFSWSQLESKQMSSPLMQIINENISIKPVSPKRWYQEINLFPKTKLKRTQSDNFWTERQKHFID